MKKEKVREEANEGHVTHLVDVYTGLQAEEDLKC